MAESKKSAEAPAIKTVRIFNRASKLYTHRHEGVDYHAHPSTFADVPQGVADKWMQMFPEDIVEAAVAQKEINGSAAEAAGLREKVAELETELKKSTSKRVSDLQADLDTANAKIAELEEKLKSTSVV